MPPSYFLLSFLIMLQEFIAVLYNLSECFEITIQMEFVFWANWDTKSPAIAGLLVMVSSTLLAHRGGEGHGDELRSW
uniref:Uncharacterized protein n=1 Tax=Populus trichocarpa TaxID=3694 RepID=A0A3N7H0M3_POPTR